MLNYEKLRFIDFQRVNCPLLGDYYEDAKKILGYAFGRGHPAFRVPGALRCKSC